MRAQFDGKIRIVALANLEAMAKRASGVCHRFWVELPRSTAAGAKRGRFVRLFYSNPNEYGAERPFYAELPIISVLGKGMNTDPEPMIGLDTLVWGRVVGEGDTWNGEGWQAFHPVIDAPELFRNPSTDQWQTREEIESAKAPAPVTTGLEGLDKQPMPIID